MSFIDIDALYDSFCSSLPEDTERVGRALAFELGLAPDASVPWSNVFRNEVTLKAPVFFTEGRANVEQPLLEQSLLGHVLGVIEAFAGDRVADGQIPEQPVLLRLLGAMREARNEALVTVGGPAFRDRARAADARTHEAIGAERTLLRLGKPVSLERYEQVSAAKQAVGMVATSALATSLGLGEGEISAMEGTLLDVALGLQFHDDVVDWPEDAARGGAWAVVLAKSALQNGAGMSDERLVLASGIAAKMLDLARTHYGAAIEGAEALGARRLAEWARGRAAEVEEQRDGERRSAGYTARLRKLSAWKAEFLS